MMLLEYKAIWPVPKPPSIVVAPFARHLAIQTAQPEVLLPNLISSPTSVTPTKTYNKSFENQKGRKT